MQCLIECGKVCGHLCVYVSVWCCSGNTRRCTPLRRPSESRKLLPPQLSVTLRSLRFFRNSFPLPAFCCWTDAGHFYASWAVFLLSLRATRVFPYLRRYCQSWVLFVSIPALFSHRGSTLSRMRSLRAYFCSEGGQIATIWHQWLPLRLQLIHISSVRLRFLSGVLPLLASGAYLCSWCESSHFPCPHGPGRFPSCRVIFSHRHRCHGKRICLLL